jgi:hypothetical protein
VASRIKSRKRLLRIMPYVAMAAELVGVLEVKRGLGGPT